MHEPKDVWDKISSVSVPLGTLVVGLLGAIFSYIYNRSLERIARLQEMEKLFPYLSSDDPQHREFGYSTFAALGEARLAARLIYLKRDAAGHDVLVQLKTDSNPRVRGAAIKGLEALLTPTETATVRGVIGTLEGAPMNDTERAAEETAATLATDLGLKLPLSIAIVDDTVTWLGIGTAKRLAKATSDRLGGPPSLTVDEKMWTKAFLDARSRALPGISPNSAAGRNRPFAAYIAANSWDLSSPSGA